MRLTAVMVVLLGVVVAVMGCATTIDYSKYSTEQLRQQLALERQTVSFHGEAVDRRQYQAVFGNDDGRPYVSPSGGLMHAIASRVHYNRAQAIETELLKRGEQP